MRNSVDSFLCLKKRFIVDFDTVFVDEAGEEGLRELYLKTQMCATDPHNGDRLALFVTVLFFRHLSQRPGLP